MTKFRWGIAELELSFGSLADRLRKRQFALDEEGYSQGFRIQDRKSGLLSGQFIERETWIETMELPSGEKLEEARSSVQVTQFQLREGHPLNLLMTDPPRRVTPFFDALAEATGFKVAVDPIRADLLKWVANLEEATGGLTVTYADCSGIPLSESVVGRFAFRGTRDVRPEVSRATGKRTPTLEAVKCEFRLSGTRIVVDLFRNGLAKVTDGDPEVFALVDRALQTATIDGSA